MNESNESFGGVKKMRTILSPKFLLMMDIHFMYFVEYFEILE